MHGDRLKKVCLNLKNKFSLYFEGHFEFFDVF